jgi:molybdopterin biosynthesis enzyme MoaB
MRRKVDSKRVRIQVLLSESEREAFRREADREGQSLSSWLRESGVERLEGKKVEKKKRRTTAELKRFFSECTRREKLVSLTGRIIFE